MGVRRLFSRGARPGPAGGKNILLYLHKKNAQKHTMYSILIQKIEKHTNLASQGASAPSCPPLRGLPRLISVLNSLNLPLLSRTLDKSKIVKIKM